MGKKKKHKITVSLANVWITEVLPWNQAWWSGLYSQGKDQMNDVGLLVPLAEEGVIEVRVRSMLKRQRLKA